VNGSIEGLAAKSKETKIAKNFVGNFKWFYTSLLFYIFYIYYVCICITFNEQSINSLPIQSAENTKYAVEQNCSVLGK
jgi:hypothetical protein